MKIDDPAGMDEFLSQQPLMAQRPKPGCLMRLVGVFRFSASDKNFGIIADEYELEIELPPDFPSSPPKVCELGGRIPRDGKHHINRGDDSLCLGSPLGLSMRLQRKPTLAAFATSCIVPYLYAMTYKIRTGGDFPFGELEHGTRGELDDYRDILKLPYDNQVIEAFILLGMKKRIANKKPCPCHCGKRLGRCRQNDLIRPLRQLVGRKWFSERLKR